MKTIRIVLFAVLALSAPAVVPAAGRPAPSADLPHLLQQAGKAVEEFWEQMSSVTCIENVSQVKLGKENKVLYRQESVFDYLILMHLLGDDISVEESRFLQPRKGGTENRPLLVTSGFSTLALILHPFYQNSYEFQWLGEEALDGQPCIRLHFQHVAGMRSPSVLRADGRDYPLRWQGTVWVHRDTAQVQKITATLLESMPEIGLQRLESEVVYLPCRFTETGDEFRLPQTASIEAETAHQHWRNLHRFSDYKQFTVKTRSDVTKK